MGKSIVFGLGKASDLAQRNLTIYNISVEPRVELYNQNLSGSLEVVEIDLPHNILCEAIQTDTRDATGSPTSVPAVLKFCTNDSIPFPAPDLRILSVEDTSSSSSSSSLSSSSSSSLSSSSSSLSSSSSSSSASSSSSSSLSSSSSSSSLSSSSSSSSSSLSSSSSSSLSSSSSSSS